MSIWLTEIWRAWRASLRRPGFLLLASLLACLLPAMRAGRVQPMDALRGEG